jgi:exodeoxyribonuclease-1
MNSSYLFYDIETTGLNPCFDQILQFAAIRTDLNLQELERFNFTVKLNIDMIPAPAAVLTHCIGAQQFQNGVTEWEALLQIHRLFNTPGTISLGYNTLGFDDEFLRFSFYRNLLPPYTHQYAQNCSRMDLYPITVMFYLFKPGVLAHWPYQNEKISLKLANISKLNLLAEGQAHNAMVDVEATVSLARKFIQEREMWNYLIGYFNKNTDEKRQTNFSTGLNFDKEFYAEALMIDGKFGANQNFVAPVLFLGQHNLYKNQLWLRLDTENLLQAKEDNIHEKAFVIRKKLGEGEFLLPLKSSYAHLLSPQRWQIFHKHKQWLLENPGLFNSLRQYYRSYIYPKIPNLDADAALYEVGFSNNSEEKVFQKFHCAAKEKKWEIAGQFLHPVRREQALRIMGRHFYEYLPNAEKEFFRNYLHKSLHSLTAEAPIDFKGLRKLTIPAALHELEQLQKTANNPEHNHLLKDLNDYLLEKLDMLTCPQNINY